MRPPATVNDQRLLRQASPFIWPVLTGVAQAVPENRLRVYDMVKSVIEVLADPASLLEVCLPI